MYICEQKESKPRRNGHTSLNALNPETRKPLSQLCDKDNKGIVSSSQCQSYERAVTRVISLQALSHLQKPLTTLTIYSLLTRETKTQTMIPRITLQVMKTTVPTSKEVAGLSWPQRLTTQPAGGKKNPQKLV